MKISIEVYVLALVLLVVTACSILNVVDNNHERELAGVQTAQNASWCKYEVLMQASELTEEVYADTILEVYQVCVDSPDEFPLNAFQASVYEE